MEQIPTGNGGQHIKLLAGMDDEHEGVIVELSEQMTKEAFASMLKASVTQWRKQGKKGIWIKLPIQMPHLIEVAVQEGFWYHHAEPKYLMVVNWIQEGPNTIPENASHRVSMGAFIMNEKRELLVVQEKNGILKGKGVWKIPTGVLDQGEDICAAAIREVKEETNIDTKFVELLAFRQSQKVFFGKSDILFLCLLQPLSFDIKKQELEIEAAMWMAVDEYKSQPFVQKNEFWKCSLDICLQTINQSYFGFSPVSIGSNNSDYFWFNTRTSNRSSKGKASQFWFLHKN